MILLSSIIRPARVVNVRRCSFDVFIGRPSKWGNPFTHLPLDRTLALYKVKSRVEAIRRYEMWLQLRGQAELLSQLGELKGQVLGCYCAPLPCHGDVLIRLLRELHPETPARGLE